MSPQSHTALPSRQSSTLTMPFPFLSLPTELRLQIYEELLIDPVSFVMPIAKQAPTRCNKSKSLCPAILRVSRSIHEEALPALYSGNTFWIRTFPTKFCVPEIVASIGFEKAKLIRRVFVSLYKDDMIQRDLVGSMYAGLGIEFESLHTWAVRTRYREAWERNAEEQGDWLVKLEEKDLLRLDIESEWFDFGTPEEDFWLVKRGSTPRGQPGWKIG